VYSSELNPSTYGFTSPVKPSTNPNSTHWFNLYCSSSIEGSNFFPVMLERPATNPHPPQFETLVTDLSLLQQVVAVIWGDLVLHLATYPCQFRSPRLQCL